MGRSTFLRARTCRSAASRMQPLRTCITGSTVSDCLNLAARRRKHGATGLGPRSLATLPDMSRRMRELDAAKRKAVAEAVTRVSGSGPLSRLPERRGLIETGQPTALFAGVPLHFGRIAVALRLAYGRFNASMLRAL